MITVLVLGAVGALLGDRLPIPGGNLLGAMAFAAGYQVLSGGKGGSSLPNWVLLLTYTLLGVEIGLAVTRDALAALRQEWLPLVVLATSVFAAALGTAWAVSKIFSFDLTTAVLSASPGGLSGMAAIGLGTRANLAQVVAVHSIRLLLIFGTVPLIILKLAGKKAG